MMRNEIIEGIGSITKGEYDVIKIEGISKIKENVICNNLHVEGLLKVKGKVNTQIFNCEGITRSFGNINAKEVEINGVLKLRRAKLECDLINCDGIIVCNKEISSDEIYIDGACSVKRMYGDKITIKNESNHITEQKIPRAILPFCYWYFGRKLSLSHSIIDNIECTELVANNLKAKVVKAQNITLGENCEIDRIECSGELKYHDSCKIDKISASKMKKQDEEQCKKKFKNNVDESMLKIDNMVKEGTLTREEGRKMINSIERKIY